MVGWFDTQVHFGGEISALPEISKSRVKSRNFKISFEVLDLGSGMSAKVVLRPYCLQYQVLLGCYIAMLHKTESQVS